MERYHERLLLGRYFFVFKMDLLIQIEITKQFNYFSFKNEEIGFILLSKLNAIRFMSSKSIRWLFSGVEVEFCKTHIIG